MFPHRGATEDGMLLYGTNVLDHFRRAAGYIHRILQGEKPADLPVQQPTQLNW
jgi:putative ABC transport system substrate-binding protein